MDNCGGTQSSKGRHAPYGCQMKQLLPTQKLQIPDHQIREFRPLQVIKFIGSFARRARSRAANSRNLRASNDYAWQLKDLKMSSPLKHAGLGVRNYKQTGPFWSTVDKIWRLSALSLFGATLAAGIYILATSLSNLFWS